MILNKQFYWAILIALMAFSMLLIGRSEGAEDVSSAGNAISAESPWTLIASPLSTAGQKASVPSLALEADGTLHAAFKMGSTVVNTANEAYYTTSTNGGTTWATPEVIHLDPFSFVVDKVDIAVDASGNVHAVWVEKDNSTLAFTLYYAVRSGNSWSAPETVATVPNPFVIDQPSIALDGSNVYVAWSSNSRVRFASRIGSWSTPKEIGPSELPEIEVDSSGVIHMVYLESRDTLVARYTQSTDGGVNWTNDIGISNSSKDVKDLDLAVKGTSVHVVFGASIVVGGAIDPISSTPRIDPYYTACMANCTSAASWVEEMTSTNVVSGNAPADAILLVPSIKIIDQGEALIFYHGVLAENPNFEQVLGSCFQPNQQAATNYRVPTAFTERMVKPQIEYSNGVMHMVYERVKGQSTSTNFQEVHYAQLQVNCYRAYLPFVVRQ